jgi:hypothetical protein
MKKFFIAAFAVIAIVISVSSCRSSAVVVSTPPPRPVYVRPATPGPGYIWVEGNYIRNGRGYIYKPGYWSVPPRRYRASSYRPGYWAPRGNTYHWHRGRW